VKRLPDGSNRINCIELKAEKPVVIINAYAPCKGMSDSKDSFNELLDQLHNIIQKYRLSHDIVLCGDMNASLHSEKPDSRDRTFRKFCEDIELQLPKGYPHKDTFTSPNGSSQIDYFLTTNQAVVHKVEILDHHAVNTSDHTPITAEIQALYQRKRKHQLPKIQRILWGIGDLLAYKEKLETMLEALPPEDVEERTSTLMKTLKLATVDTIPTKATKLSNCKMPWNEETNRASQSSKAAHREWVAGGRPGPDSDLHINRTVARKALRREQRRTHSRIDDDRYNSIMLASKNKDQKTLANLINSQRNTRSTNTNSLMVDDLLHEGPQEVLEGWAKYQTKLGSPTESTWFDSHHLATVDTDVKSILDICWSSKDKPTPYTEMEVAIAISSMKTGKVSDSYGISAEHLKYGGKGVVLTLLELFNSILYSTVYPEAFRIGTISPIYKKGKNPEPRQLQKDHHQLQHRESIRKTIHPKNKAPADEQTEPPAIWVHGEHLANDRGSRHYRNNRQRIPAKQTTICGLLRHQESVRRCVAQLPSTKAIPIGHRRKPLATGTRNVQKHESHSEVGGSHL
jgi:hypothetical protein